MFIKNNITLAALVSTLLLFPSCNSNKNNFESKKKVHESKSNKDIKKHPVNNTIENSDVTFETFFNKFQSDQNFQLERIQFPIKVVSEVEENETKVIKKDKWVFTEFDKIKDIQISKTSISKDQIDVTTAILDTGVQVIYHFKKLNGKWRLYGMTDRSD